MYEPKKTRLSLKDTEPGELFMFSYYRAEEGRHGPYISILGVEFNEERAKKFKDFGMHDFHAEQFGGSEKIDGLWEKLEKLDTEGNLVLAKVEPLLITFLESRSKT